MIEVYTELSEDTLKELLVTSPSEVIVLKFTATWCKPCQRIAQLVCNHFRDMPDNVTAFELDIDDECNKPLYSFLKKKRMVVGVPAILVFYGNIKRDHWFIPDIIVNNSNVNDINRLFSCVKEAANKINV
uniref:Thioredoxin domain-containing protein n=1 Tax=viral metagenome TaxID=1070528 RepID=A0A6C0BWF5_9ZZZZ